MNKTATAISHPNIAFIKYWGNRDPKLRIPSNGSISMNLSGLETRTSVTFSEEFDCDQLKIHGQQIKGDALTRVSKMLDQVRRLAGIFDFALVESENNFPTGTGIASSASAFSALALAASNAAGLTLDERQTSILARTGSGSACRSVPGGFVEWFAGKNHNTSFARSFAPAHHWELSDCIAIISREHKTTGSTDGHALASTSPLQSTRVADAPRRLEICKKAIIARDFEVFLNIVELDSNLMHAVMQTSSPALLYWLPATVAVMIAVKEWRNQGLSVCFTIDAGPNVHVICPDEQSLIVSTRLKQIPGVLEVLLAKPGGPAHLVTP